MSQLPEFAAQWIKQWKEAAPRLQQIRDEELRRRDERPRVVGGGVARPVIWDRYPERHGMVIMQRWFMRRQLLSLREAKSEDRGGS